MIPPEVVVVPAIFLIPSGVIFARMWFKHKERMATLTAPQDDTRELLARLERMEQAIDAVAIEMERIGEGQRFVTRLLAEKSSASPRAG